jgi:hypothetical protein
MYNDSHDENKAKGGKPATSTVGAANNSRHENRKVGPISL